MGKPIERKVVRGIIHKYCARCHEYRPESEFNRCTKSPDHLQGYCRPCNVDYCRAWHKEHEGR